MTNTPYPNPVAAWKHRTRLERVQNENTKDWLSIVGMNETTRVRLRITKEADGDLRFDLTDRDDLPPGRAWDPPIQGLR
jgi:hypothetical protein